MTRRSLYFQPEIRPSSIPFSKRQGTEHLRGGQSEDKRLLSF